MSTHILTQPMFYILLILSLKRSHGYEIMKQVPRVSNKQVMLGPGTLYGALKRMLEDELITEEPEPNSRRRYYSITQKGISLLTTELNRYKDILHVAQKSSLLITQTAFYGQADTLY